LTRQVDIDCCRRNGAMPELLLDSKRRCSFLSHQRTKRVFHDMGMSMRCRESRRLGNLAEQLPHRDAVEFRGTLGVKDEFITVSGPFLFPSPQGLLFIERRRTLNLEERLITLELYRMRVAAEKQRGGKFCARPVKPFGRGRSWVRRTRALCKFN